MSDTPAAQIGHNKPPVTPPNEGDVLEDLKNRFKIDDEAKKYEEAFAEFPEKIEDEAVAASLQDLMRRTTSQKAAWKGQRSAEKKPWDTLAKVVMNFFSKGEDRLDALIETWKPRYQAYLDAKEAENRRKAEEERKRQEEAAEAKRKEAEEADARAREAEERKRKAEEDERKAREETERLERERKEAEEKAEAAKVEAARIEREKKEREKKEREDNESGLRQIRRHMKDAEKLHALAEADEATDTEIAQLDAFIKPGGMIGILARPIGDSTLLSDEQKAEIDDVRKRLGEFRDAVNARFDKKEKKRREKEQKEAEERDRIAAEERDKKRKDDEERARKAKEDADAAEAAAKAAKEKHREAQAVVRQARSAGREASADIKDAERDATHAGREADRAENRADRLARKIENSTDADFSRTRGDLSVGSITGRWVYEIVDEEALRKVCGPLAPHFMTDALEGAVYRWMGAHREGFTGERVTPAELPGVVFKWERDAAIRG